MKRILTVAVCLVACVVSAAAGYLARPFFTPKGPERDYMQEAIEREFARIDPKTGQLVWRSASVANRDAGVWIRCLMFQDEMKAWDEQQASFKEALKNDLGITPDLPDDMVLDLLLEADRFAGVTYE